MFNFFKKNKSMGQENDYVKKIDKLEPAEDEKALNLTKEQLIEDIEDKQNILNKCIGVLNLNKIECRVAVVIDVSGSMERNFKSGLVQDLFQKLIPLGLNFDDNQNLDVWAFSSRFKKMPSLTMDNFFDYTEKNFLQPENRDFWRGTNYAPVINDVYNKYVKEEPSNIPTFVIFITDGDNGDKEKTTRLIKEISKNNIFWQFVGIGSDRFYYLEKLDNLKGRFIDNANFFQVDDINTLSGQDLYNKLLAEYPIWENEFKRLSKK